MPQRSGTHPSVGGMCSCVWLVLCTAVGPGGRRKGKKKKKKTTLFLRAHHSKNQTGRKKNKAPAVRRHRVIKWCRCFPPSRRGFSTSAPATWGPASASSPLPTSHPRTGKCQTVSTLHTCPREQNHLAEDLLSGGLQTTARLPVQDFVNFRKIRNPGEIQFL